MAKIKFVAQKNRSSGCGPACIAMLAGARLAKSPGKAYDQAVDIIFGEGRTRNLYTTWDQLRNALDHLSIEYADRIYLHRSWKTITTLSIVKCSAPGNEDWHWAVYDGHTGILYDPLRKEPVRANGRGRKPRSHLPIYLFKPLRLRKAPFVCIWTLRYGTAESARFLRERPAYPQT